MLSVSQHSEFRALCNQFVSLAEFLKHTLPLWSSLGLHPKAKEYKEEEERLSSRLYPKRETKPNISAFHYCPKAYQYLQWGKPGTAKMCSNRGLAVRIMEK
jgi:hypothetical protein